MSDWTVLKNRMVATRDSLADLLAGEAHRGDVIPPTWNNNLRWHVGHLVTSPYILTHGLFGEPLPLPSEYRKWFARGTSPREWGDAPVPRYEVLLAQLTEAVPALFSAFEDRATEPFPKPYTTSLGIELVTPEDALSFSLIHDGLHYGMIQALKRALDAAT
jgi:hypothetical protein